MPPLTSVNSKRCYVPAYYVLGYADAESTAQNDLRV